MNIPKSIACDDDGDGDADVDDSDDYRPSVMIITTPKTLNSKP